MKNLTPGTSYTEPFKLSSTPDADPTATVYAGSTSLGSASIAADTGENSYIATVTLPSTGLTDGVLIRVKVSWAVSSTAHVGWLDVGVVNLYAVIAAAVLTAAEESPINSNVTHVLGEPAEPVDDVAKQETLEEVLGAVGDVTFGAVVVPLLGQIQSRTEGTTIRVYTQETTTITLAVVNAMGEPVDLDGMTLSLVIERAKGGDISVIDDGDIAVNESTISFAIPAEVSAAEGYHNWALRGSDGTVLMQGPLIVEYAPEVDT